jgi:predicted chitinase
MPVTRANVEATKAFIRARLGNPYVYGGALSTNVKQGTDCSEVWQTVLEMVHGRWKAGRQSEGATTESYRYVNVGGVGPFGTIRVAHWRDIPANAAAKLAFHHGPGGGANSHMWGELDGMRIESGGSKGLVTAPRALAIDNSYGTAWAYLPGPIADDGTPIPPAPAEVVMLGRRHESSGDRVRQLQEALNRNGASIEADGDFGPLTESAVTAYQRSKGLEIDGVAGPATLASLGLKFGAPPPPPPGPPPTSTTGGLTPAVLHRIMDRRLPLDRYAELLPGVLQCLRDSGCHTIERRAMWFAQIGHESGGFVHKRELASGDAYDTRTDLGNTPQVDGDGARYKGRGWVQLTGAGHYRDISRWAHGLGLVPTPTWFFDHPEQMETDANAFLVTRYYWTVARPQMNSLADRRDLLGATRAVNGGTNGLDDRRDFYTRALAAGADLLDPSPLDELEAILMANEPRPSQSHFRADNKPVLTPLDALYQANAMKHEEMVIEAAEDGELWAIQDLAKLAAGVLPGAKDPDGPFWVARAAKKLNEIYAARPDLITAATPGKA